MHMLAITTPRGHLVLQNACMDQVVNVDIVSGRSHNIIVQNADHK